MKLAGLFLTGMLQVSTSTLMDHSRAARRVDGNIYATEEFAFLLKDGQVAVASGLPLITSHLLDQLCGRFGVEHDKAWPVVVEDMLFGKRMTSEAAQSYSLDESEMGIRAKDKIYVLKNGALVTVLKA